MTNSDIDYIEQKLGATTLSYPQMVKRYGADFRSWPTTTAWWQALNRLESARVAPPPPPPPAPSYGARSLPQGPFTDRTTALWYRSNNAGTVSKQHVHDTGDYGVAAMGYFSPAPPAPSAGVLTVTDVIGERVGHSPPTSNGTAEAGVWLGQKVNAARLLGNGTWMGAWTGCQCADFTITDLTCAVLNPDGSLGKLPGIGLYVEHCTRRGTIDGITTKSHGNGLNIEWWYADAGYAPYVAKELPGAPAGRAGSWSLEIKNFDIQSDAAGIFVDAGNCGIKISNGITNAPIYLPKNLAVPSMPNVVDEASITYTGSGDLVRYHSNGIGGTMRARLQASRLVPFLNVHPATVRGPQIANAG